MVNSEYHGHDIVPWAVEEKCCFCDYPASHKVEESIIDLNTHPLTAYVCCDHFWGNCSNRQAPSCPTCHHIWPDHNHPDPYYAQKGVADEYPYVCVAYAGMGDWCGCEKKK